MTTQILDRVPVDAITEHARTVKPGRTLLTLVAAVLFGAGWVVARLFSGVWLCATWCWAAVAVGWKAAHGPSRADQIAALTAQVQELETRLSRFAG